MIRLLVVSVLCLFVVLVSAQDNRTIDGINNNPNNNEWGATSTPLLRVSPPSYTDGTSQINQLDLPLARKVSNDLFTQNDNIAERKNLSDFTWVFGQFLYNDISQVVNGDESVELEVPSNDLYFLPNETITANRNAFTSDSGINMVPRTYENAVTSFIDGSVVYGSTIERAQWLRSSIDGKLRVSEQNGIYPLLPWNTGNAQFNSSVDNEAPNMAFPDDPKGPIKDKFFIAGDSRANENPLLLAMHIIFVREHNRLCDILKGKNPDWDDEQIYQRARKMVGAILQSITYNEWLPSIGINLPSYIGYNEDINPAIFNEFNAAAFKFGETSVNGTILRIDNNGEEISSGNISFKDAYYFPIQLIYTKGIDVYLKGMGTQPMQEMDCKIIDDIRNFNDTDFAAINIFRGRDRGISDYNSMRKAFGLAPVTTFSDFTSTVEDNDVLNDLYPSVDHVDAWVGMMSEKHLGPNTIFGELSTRIIKEQFKVLRDGDRFYYENDISFNNNEIEEIKNTTLFDVIMRNSQILLMQENLFLAMPHQEILSGPIVFESLEAVIYPNPVVEGETYINVFSDEDQLVSLRLHDQLGNLISDESIVLNTGMNTIPYTLDSKLYNGVYVLIIESQSQSTILRLIKQ